MSDAATIEASSTVTADAFLGGALDVEPGLDVPLTRVVYGDSSDGPEPLPRSKVVVDFREPFPQIKGHARRGFEAENRDKVEQRKFTFVAVVIIRF